MTYRSVYVNRAPDDFCLLAGVGEGTVKGCMIEKQEASLIALLGGPQVAATISTWGLWSVLHAYDYNCVTYGSIFLKCNISVCDILYYLRIGLSIKQVTS